jgi:hypothetical protein
MVAIIYLAIGFISASLWIRKNTFDAEMTFMTIQYFWPVCALFWLIHLYCSWLTIENKE